MTHTVRSHQGDTLDRLCHRHLGTTAGVTEQTIRLNPGIAELGPVLPHGTRVTLPDEHATQPLVADIIQLWT